VVVLLTGYQTVAIKLTIKVSKILVSFARKKNYDQSQSEILLNNICSVQACFPVSNVLTAKKT